MPTQHTAISCAKQTKRARLREIVERLGMDATAPQIREEAYKVGFGAINSLMLILVRNELWPDRPKHSCGYRNHVRRAILSETPCPACGSKRNSVRSIYKLKTTGKWRRYRNCLDCKTSFFTVDEPERLSSRHARRIAVAAITEKRCTYCKTLKPVESFPLVRNSDDILRRPGCKQCYADKWTRRSFLKTLAGFGVTEEWYQKTLEVQRGGCGICGSLDPGVMGGRKKVADQNRRFAVDHCHRTGKARGLLCAKCNLALGNFNDDAERIRSAIAYLELHKSGQE